MPNKPYSVLLYVARHGTTTLNQKNCFRGPLDPELDKKGWRDANALAFWFEPIDLAGVFTSPKKRSRSTATLIHDHQGPGVRYVTHNDLRALDVGNLGGKEKTPENQEIVDTHVENPDLVFEGGESLNGFRARVRPLLYSAVNLAMEADRPVLIVAHSSVVHETGELFNGDHSSVLVKPGGVAAVYISEGKFKAEAIFKPDLEKIGKERSEAIT